MFISAPAHLVKFGPSPTAASASYILYVLRLSGESYMTAGKQPFQPVCDVLPQMQIGKGTPDSDRRGERILAQSWGDQLDGSSGQL